VKLIPGGTSLPIGSLRLSESDRILPEVQGSSGKFNRSSGKLNGSSGRFDEVQGRLK